MRAPRRSFANPFVVTLAALPIATVAACNPPPHRNPPGPTIVTPPPTTDSKPPPAQPDKAVVMENPPRPTQPDPEPPKTAPAMPSTWNVSRKGATCTVFDNNACRQVQTEKPVVVSCNPPPPRATKCPDGLADGASVTITQYAGQSECFINPTTMPKCPPNATCNPPPPRKVACP